MAITWLSSIQIETQTPISRNTYTAKRRLINVQIEHAYQAMHMRRPELLKRQ